MIKAYHNCTPESAELIKKDGKIRSNAELQRRGADRCRITGFSTKDTRFVFLYPECFQHSEDRSTYRNREELNEVFVAFVFDAEKLVKRYNAIVGKDLIALDVLAGLIPDIRQRELAQAEIRKNNRYQGEAALKQLWKGMENPTEDGFIEILVPRAIPLKDCIGLVNANTGESLQDEFHNPSKHMQSSTQNRQRKKQRRKK